jgi:hypothetical protein
MVTITVAWAAWAISNQLMAFRLWMLSAGFQGNPRRPTKQHWLFDAAKRRYSKFEPRTRGVLFLGTAAM